MTLRKEGQGEGGGFSGSLSVEWEGNSGPHSFQISLMVSRKDRRVF